jgi:murein DD-endopeptidase MepM/ murein hydrolase activator NlpD
MRTRSSVLSALTLLALLPAQARASFREGFADFFHGIAVKFRIMRLTTQPADSIIIHPLRTSRVARIGDTWHAGRGGGRQHEGQDIFAPRGTSIHAATMGYVTRIGENRLGGRTVWVIGAGGRVYYYAHLDAYADSLKVGDRVDTATVLGYVGTSGNAEGGRPHLHFGVYTLTGPIDPLPLLRDPPRPLSKLPASPSASKPARKK